MLDERSLVTNFNFMVASGLLNFLKFKYAAM